MALPTTMKTVHQLDPMSATLTLTPSVPLPKTTPEYNHLLKVMATSPCLNELDWAAYNPEPDLERTPGSEASAIVVQAPKDSPFQPGTEVFYRMFTRPNGLPIPGCLREYTVARQSELAPKPRALTWEEAASVPLSALTAWQGLFEHGTLDSRAITTRDAEARTKNGKIRVLVTGASGGVGAWLVQLASLAGAGAVIALCHPSKSEFVLSKGATEVIPYTTETIESWAGKNDEVDLIIDVVGGKTLKSLWAAVKSGGTILTVASTDREVIKPEGVKKDVAKSQWYLVESRGDELAEIGKIIEEGKAKPLVDSVFEFEDFDAAFERVQSRKANGKVVIKVGA